MTERGNDQALDRRGFLRSTAAIGSSLLLSASALHGASKPQGEAIDVALIGCGTQGQNLLKSCVKIPGIRIQAICDIWEAFNQKRTSNFLKLHRHEHRKYRDYRELLDREKGLDAVLVATPDFWHAEHATACLDAGLNVYCEKPLSNTRDGARRMVQKAEQSDKLLAIGHQRRSNPRYIHCCDNLLGEARLIGRITTINGQWNRPVQPDRGWPKRFPIEDSVLNEFGFQSMHQFRNWRWYRALGSGPMGELGSDQIDVFNWSLNSYPVSVMASGGTDYYDRKTHEWPDTVLAIYEYNTPKGPVRAFYQTISTNSSYGHYEKILGDQGSLMISEAGRAGVYRESTAPDWGKWVRLDYLRETGQKSKQSDKSPSLDVTATEAPSAYALPVALEDPSHKPHIENFFDAIRGNARLNCSPPTAHAALVCALAANDAVGAGKKIELGPDAFRA